MSVSLASLRAPALAAVLAFALAACGGANSSDGQGGGENNAPVDYESPTEFFRFWDIEDLKED